VANMEKLTDSVPVSPRGPRWGAISRTGARLRSWQWPRPQAPTGGAGTGISRGTPRQGDLTLLQDLAVKSSNCKRAWRTRARARTRAIQVLLGKISIPLLELSLVHVTNLGIIWVTLR
jgi:hypothetical protein